MENACGNDCGKKCAGRTGMSGGCGGAYGLAFVGAAIYYVQQSQGFWEGALGVAKALVWPAMIAHKAFALLGM